MSNIAPNSTIKILKNVPLDITHKHTIYFGSKSAQATYFNSKVQYTLNNYTYQRVQKNVCRVGIKADSLYECNYMMFQNTNYGNKWFYAFITSVEFVNNDVSEVTFEIDVMQTWLVNDDYQLGKQFIERQHARTDEIGENIVAEPVDVGEYVNSEYDVLKNVSDLCVVVGTSWIPNDFTHAIWADRQLTINLCAFTNIQNLRSMLNDYNSHPDDIQFIYMCPEFLFGNDTRVNNPLGISGDPSPRVATYGLAINGTESFGDSTAHTAYTPKNKKLYTYPYNFYMVDNSCGDTLTLRYEFFSDLTPRFEVMGTYVQPASVTCYPTHYKNSGVNPNFHESITIGNFPQCSWQADYYARWLGQSGLQTVLTGLGNAVMGARGGVYNAPITNFITGLEIDNYTASIHTDINKGKNVSNLLASKLELKFRGCRTHITANMCECIDNFFTRFGYAFNIIDIPNINSRPKWNYIKLRECTIKGSIPMNDMKAINDIYDNGITFWKNGNEVGDYTLNNDPS